MAYTIAQFITHAEQGDPIQVTKPAGNTQVLFKVGTRLVTLSDTLVTVLMAGSGKTLVSEANNVIDLGDYFSAEQVLDSTELRNAINDGLVLADVGITALSQTPVA